MRVRRLCIHTQFTFPIIFIVAKYVCRWFLAVYASDVWTRLPQLLAAATSVYGLILKIYSTKRVCKKLQGHAATPPTGPERGELVVSVLSVSEGMED